MDLYENPAPELTRWIVRSGFLSSPFVLVDVGCQGGEHPRWRWLGEQLELHGFDALEEAVGALRSANRHAGYKHFHYLALGDEDGERELFVQSNAYATSFYRQGDNSRMSVDASAFTNRERRFVPVRRLDTLFAEGRIPKADFVKLDCEGFEPEILKGAVAYLTASGPLGVEAETSFNVSPILLGSHFGAVYALLLQHRLLVFDLAFDRATRSSFAAALPGCQLGQIGQPGTFNILFARDLIAERDFPTNYIRPPIGESVSSDAVLKAAIVFELYGLLDCAHEVIVQFSAALPPGFDVTQALALLRPAAGRPDGPQLPSEGPLRGELDSVYESTSWRITAPLRALRRQFPRRPRRSTTAR